MIRIRGASGLGDSVYLRPIVEHYVRAGQRVVALSNFSDVFDGAGCSVERFRRDRVDLVAHYVGGKGNARTTQWQDMCQAAKIPTTTPLAFAWEVHNPALIAGIRERAAGRPVVVVHGGREPMGRSDGFGLELLPTERGFEFALSPLADECYLVGVGKAKPIYPLAVHEDLNGSTSVADLLDVFRSCDAVVAQCSFAVPLAEAFGRPLLAIWARRGLQSSDLYLRRITPAKILEPRAGTRWVVDDDAPAAIGEVARAFRESLSLVADEAPECAS